MRTDGFSLVELLVAMLVVAMLAAIALPTWHTQRLRAERTEARAWLLRLGNDQQAYFVRHGHYADDLIGLGFDTAAAATPDGRYLLSVVSTSEAGYRLRAERVPADREAARCAWFTLDETQARASGPRPPAECWWR